MSLRNLVSGFVDGVTFGMVKLGYDAPNENIAAIQGALLISAGLADGKLNFEEEKTLWNILRNTLPSTWPDDNIRQLITEMTKQNPAPENFASVFQGNDNKREFALMMLVLSVMVADGEVNDAEMSWISRLSQATNLNPEAWAVVMGFYQRPKNGQQNGQRWSQLLEVSADASPEEITKAYKQKAKDYHPDKLAGVSEAVRRLAEEKLKEINLAYEALRGKSTNPTEDSQELLALKPTGHWVPSKSFNPGDIVICPGCNQQNRLPEKRYFANAKCGSCHMLLGLEASFAQIIAELRGTSSP